MRWTFLQFSLGFEFTGSQNFLLCAAGYNFTVEPALKGTLHFNINLGSKVSLDLP